MKSPPLPPVLAALLTALVTVFALPAAPGLPAQEGEAEAPSPARPRVGPVKMKTIELPAPDGLVVTADLWADDQKTRPFVLLCHQARSSRGEYRAIAPRVVAAGFNCLAIDQRSGYGLPDVSKAVRNETAARARREGKKTDFAAAEQDIVAAVVWIRKQGYSGRITLWGSSYSAALAFFVAANSRDVDAVIAFSPGEYLGARGSVADQAANLKKPVLIVATQDEKRQANTIFLAAATKKKALCIDPHNLHGSRTLFMAKDPEPAWDAVRNFLRRHGRGVRRDRAGKPGEAEKIEPKRG